MILYLQSPGFTLTITQFAQNTLYQHFYVQPFGSSEAISCIFFTQHMKLFTSARDQSTKHKVLIALLPQILMLFSLKALPRTQLANSSVGILIDSANNVRKKRPIELSNFSIVNLGYLIRFCDY